MVANFYSSDRMRLRRSSNGCSSPFLENKMIMIMISSAWFIGNNLMMMMMTRMMMRMMMRMISPVSQELFTYIYPPVSHKSLYKVGNMLTMIITMLMFMVIITRVTMIITMLTMVIIMLTMIITMVTMIITMVTIIITWLQ